MNIVKFHELVNSLEKTAAHFGNPVPGKRYFPFNFNTLDDNFSLEPVVDNEE